MTPDLDAVAARLRADDPDRFAMAMLAGDARARLVTLYALNAELARTALSASEPLVAEIRVQWWVDRLGALADAAPPPHELLTPLYAAWGAQAAGFAALAEARRHDALREPFADTGAVIAYAQATGGALMGFAAGALESGGSAAGGAAGGAAVGAQGQGAALVAWLRARPALQGLGLGLARPAPEDVAALGRVARAAFKAAAAARRGVPRAAAPALFPGAGIRRALDQAQAGRDPDLPSDFARRAGLARLALTGRWWL